MMLPISISDLAFAMILSLVHRAYGEKFMAIIIIVLGLQCKAMYSSYYYNKPKTRLV